MKHPSRWTAALAAAYALAAMPSAQCGAAGKEPWKALIDPPKGYVFERSVVRGETYERPDYTIEYYTQANGPGTSQRVMMTIPHQAKTDAKRRFPAVAVPFYRPEGMIGYKPVDGEPLPMYSKIAMMADLSRRGYICISATAYYLTYLKSKKDVMDYTRWQDVGDALGRDWPSWTGMGKLTFDTRLLIDMLVADSRVDRDNIGIAGHSLGGKMALFAGAFDPRVKAILISDPGVCWDRTNWEDSWYFGAKLEGMKAAGLDLAGLMEAFGCKPLCLLAGQYDGDWSEALLRKAEGYREGSERLKVVNPRLGIHRPSPESLEAGYSFLDKHLKGAR